MYYVYALKSLKKTSFIYVGYTLNIKKRVHKHNSGEVRSTKPYTPLELIFYEAYKSRRDAKRREQYLKTVKGRRALKLMLQDSLR